MANMTAASLAAALRKSLPQLKLAENVPMSTMTTLQLGGPADLLAEPASQEEVRQVLEMTRDSEVPLTVIGRGSNLLVRDGGIRGLVLRIGPELKELRCRDESIEADAGASLAALAQFALENGLAGLSFCCGIPGSVGGAACMNAGAYGGEMGAVVSSVSGFDMAGRPFFYTGKDMGFSYRMSRLQIEEKVVTSVTFALHHGDADEIRERMNANNRARIEKQPLTKPSAGSTFRRPKTGYAAQMIDECGLKGFAVGGASVSEKHAGFLVNDGGTAADFIRLMDEVQRRVFDRFGVMLEPEVCILGEE